MVPDPARTYEAVREQHGEAEAARTLISMSKMIVSIFAIVIIMITGGFFIMGSYTASHVSTCRDIVEDRFFATVGNALLELRETGQMSPDTAGDLEVRTLAVDTITTQCPDAFWPWDIKEASELPEDGPELPPAVDPQLPQAD